MPFGKPNMMKTPRPHMRSRNSQLEAFAHRFQGLVSTRNKRSTQTIIRDWATLDIVGSVWIKREKDMFYQHCPSACIYLFLMTGGQEIVHGFGGCATKLAMTIRQSNADTRVNLVLGLCSWLYCSKCTAEKLSPNALMAYISSNRWYS